MSCNKSAQRAPNKFRNHYETTSVMFYVNRWGHTQLTRFKPSWYTNDIKRKYPGCFVSQEKRTWTLNASFYTFVNWTNCLSVWLVVWLRHVYLVCLQPRACWSLPWLLSGQVRSLPLGGPSLNRVQTPPSRQPQDERIHSILFAAENTSQSVTRIWTKPSANIWQLIWKNDKHLNDRWRHI